MDLQTIFNEIVCNFENAKNSKTPISDLIRKYDFEQVSTIEEDEHFRAILENANQRLEVFIKCHSHDKTFQSRPDTNHNYLELYDNGTRLSSLSYMYEDDE